METTDSKMDLHSVLDNDKGRRMTKEEEEELIEKKLEVIRFAMPKYGNRFLYDVLQFKERKGLDKARQDIMFMMGEFWARNYAYIIWERRAQRKVNFVFEGKEIVDGYGGDVEEDVNKTWFFIPKGAEFVLDRWGLLKNIYVPEAVMTRDEYMALRYDREHNQPGVPKKRPTKKMKRMMPDPDVLARAQKKPILTFEQMEPDYGPRRIQFEYGGPTYTQTDVVDIESSDDDAGVQ